MGVVQLNAQSITTSAGPTTAPASGVSEAWTVSALPTTVPALRTGEFYDLIDATPGATPNQQNEIIRITAAAAGATTVTVTRGWGQTTPVAHAAASTFNIIATDEAYWVPTTDVRLITAAALPSVTYANGASGVGATLTATANGPLTVDGVVTALNDLIFVKDQASALQDGLYKQTRVGVGGSVAFQLTRDTSADTSGDIIGQNYVATAGVVNRGQTYGVTNTAGPTVGTTAITVERKLITAGLSYGQTQGSASTTLTSAATLFAMTDTAVTFVLTTRRKVRVFVSSRCRVATASNQVRVIASVVAGAVATRTAASDGNSDGQVTNSATGSTGEQTAQTEWEFTLDAGTYTAFVSALAAALTTSSVNAGYCRVVDAGPG